MAGLWEGGREEEDWINQSIVECALFPSPRAAKKQLTASISQSVVAAAGSVMRLCYSVM